MDSIGRNGRPPTAGGALGSGFGPGQAPSPSISLPSAGFLSGSPTIPVGGMGSPGAPPVSASGPGASLVALGGSKGPGGISFDEFSKLRILDPATFEASEKLKDEAKEFTTKIGELTGLVSTFVGLLQDKAAVIEATKLKAIGLRNHVETEVENRKSKANDYRSLLGERNAELERLMVQTDSLTKVVADQQSLIESLGSK